MNRQFAMMVVLGSALCAAACAGPKSTFPFEDYPSMRARVGELYQAGSLQEAAELLEAALPRFPSNLETNAFNLALIYGQLGEPEKGMKAMHAAMDQGVWFNIYIFDNAALAPYRDLDGFDEIVARNDALRRADQEGTAPGVKMVLPEGFSDDRAYPLFIALHGGGGNMEDFSTIWKSDLLRREFIIAYLQSSLKVSMTGYAWTQDLEVSRREITDAYHAIVDEYPINTEEVVVGGFSAGGIAALKVILEDDFPLAGFVVLCPAQPDGFTAGTLLKVRDRGVRGTILTTEMDPNIDIQREMARLLEEVRFPYEFHVTPDIGHWFPDNLPELIDSALKHIRER